MHAVKPDAGQSEPTPRIVMMLPALALTLTLTLTEEQWHYLTCLGTARLGKAETPVLMGQALQQIQQSQVRSLPGTWPSLGSQMLVADLQARFFGPVLPVSLLLSARNLHHPGPAGPDP